MHMDLGVQIIVFLLFLIFMFMSICNMVYYGFSSEKLSIITLIGILFIFVLYEFSPYKRTRPYYR